MSKEEQGTPKRKNLRWTPLDEIQFRCDQLMLGRQTKAVRDGREVNEMCRCVVLYGSDVHLMYMPRTVRKESVHSSGFASAHAAACTCVE
jgi:hypothetical protein